MATMIGICPDMLNSVSGEIKDVVNLGTELCLVIGGGNIFRGVTGVSKGMDRTTGDNMGMLATVMNSLALKFLRKIRNTNKSTVSFTYFCCL